MQFSFSNNSVVADEIKDLIIADLALSVAFSFIFTGSILDFSLPTFLWFFPIAFVAVTLSFVLHEYMHKIVAQRFGATAAFRRSDTGLIITLITGAMGFLIGLPGATMIYTNRFTREEDGYVSLAGPLTNFIVFLVFCGLFFAVYHAFPQNILGVLDSTAPVPYLQLMMCVTLFISVWLAFFNMLPIYPLDGSKVLRWNKLAYIVIMAVIFAFLYGVIGSIIIPSLIFVLFVALLFSFMFSGMRLF